jgi:hypothetical protein
MGSARCAKPLVPGWAAGIQMGTYQLDSPRAEQYNRGDRHSALQHEGELDSVGSMERKRREDGITAITLRGAVPHGWGVSQVHAQSMSRVDDILLLSEACNEYPSDSALLERWDGRVTPVRLLYEYYQWQTRFRSERGEVSVPDASHHSLELAAADPYIPAQDDQAPDVADVCGTGGEVERNLRADIAAPLLQAESLVIFMSRQAEFWRVRNMVFDCAAWPPTQDFKVLYFPARACCTNLPAMELKRR